MKLELTKQQIELLVEAESTELKRVYDLDIKRLEALHKASIAKLDKALETELQKLTDKYKFIDVEPTKKAKKEATTRTPFDVEQLKQLVEDNKSVKEIAATISKTEAQVRSKLFNLGIKLSDKK